MKTPRHSLLCACASVLLAGLVAPAQAAPVVKLKTISTAFSNPVGIDYYEPTILLGAPAGPTRVISIAAYEAAFEQYDYGMASAIAIVMGFVQLLIVGAIFAFRQAFYSGPATSGKG